LWTATWYGSILIPDTNLIRKTNGGNVLRNSLKTAALSFGIAVLLAGVAAGGGTVAVKVTLKGNAAVASGGNTGTNGQCTATGDPWLDDYACSSGNCACHEITATASGTGLKGATVTNFFVTDDKGINAATEGAVGSGPNPDSNLLLGIVTITDKSGDSLTINFLGVDSKHVIGFSSRNPGGNTDKNLFFGGWGVSATPSATVATSGWGTFTGTDSKTTNKVSFLLNGWMTQ
jgi:hypothetical protein